ncbi:MAG TPA: hypothetical protein VNZ64_27360 [Candidatus Acidoferrum sp.]|jgi:hypothetical protein|nr:hypothetical protein [Candidatus Acidoferrum sp.]
MARNPEVEQILEAWWQLDHIAPHERAKSEKQLNGLLDKVVVRGAQIYTREQILDYLWPQYRDYRLAKKKNEQVGVAQAALKK